VKWREEKQREQKRSKEKRGEAKRREEKRREEKNLSSKRLPFFMLYVLYDRSFARIFYKRDYRAICLRISKQTKERRVSWITKKILYIITPNCGCQKISFKFYHIKKITIDDCKFDFLLHVSTIFLYYQIPSFRELLLNSVFNSTNIVLNFVEFDKYYYTKLLFNHNNRLSYLCAF